MTFAHNVIAAGAAGDLIRANDFTGTSLADKGTRLAEATRAPGCFRVACQRMRIAYLPAAIDARGQARRAGEVSSILAEPLVR